jgi:hypothetical protein
MLARIASWVSEKDAPVVVESGSAPGRTPPSDSGGALSSNGSPACAS